MEVVRKYILNQKEHHINLSYKEEIEKFIKEYDIIEYDENYFWE